MKIFACLALAASVLLLGFQTQDAYRLDLHVLSETTEQGIRFQIEGVAAGSPTFPENALFKLEVRRRTYTVVWGSKEIREAESKDPLLSLFGKLNKGSFIHQFPQLPGRGTYLVTAEFNPQDQQYKNVVPDMGGACKPYRFSTTYLVADMTEQAGENMATEVKMLMEEINATATFLENLDKAGREAGFPAREQQTMVDLGGRQGMYDSLKQTSSFTIVPNLLSAMMHDIQPYLVGAFARAKGGKPPFEIVAAEDPPPSKKVDNPNERKSNEGAVAPASSEDLTGFATSYGGRLALQPLKEDIDMARELLVREEMLLSLGLLAQGQKDLLAAYAVKDKELEIVFEHVESAATSLGKRHTEAMKDPEMKGLRLDALKGREKEYLTLLTTYNKFFKVPPDNPKAAEEAKKVSAETAKLIDELRAEIVKPRKPDEIPDLDDEKKDPKKEGPKKK